MAKGNELVAKLTEALEQATAGLQSGTLHGMAESLAGIDVSLKGNVLGELVRALRSLTEQIANMVRHPETAQERGFLHRGARGGPLSGGVKHGGGPGEPEGELYTGQNAIPSSHRRMRKAIEEMTMGLHKVAGLNQFAGRGLAGKVAEGGGSPAAVGAVAAIEAGFDSMKEGLQNQRQLTGMTQFARGGAAIGGAAAGAVAGSVVPGVGTVAGAAIGGGLGYLLGSAAVKLAEAADALKEFGSKELGGMFKYANVSPSMAMVQARFQMQEMLLGMERGERLAPAAAKLADAQIKYERSLAPIEDAWVKGKAWMATEAMDKVGTEAFEGILDGMRRGFDVDLRGPGLPHGLPAEFRDRPHRLRGMGDFSGPDTGGGGADF